MKANISITIEDELLRKLKEMADQENRNLSNYIESILLKELNK